MSLRNNTILLALFLSAFLIWAQPGWAADSSMNLAKALARTIRDNPELAVYSWEIRAAEARVMQSKLRPNPEISLQVENITGSGSYKSADAVENTLLLSQLIELGGKPEARVREARSGVRLVSWDYEIKRIEVLKETTFAFIEVLAAQNRVDLAEETVGVAERVVPITQKQVQAGKASDVDLTRANLAVASARIDREQAKQDLLGARSNLATHWGGKEADFGNLAGTLEQVKPLPKRDALIAKMLRHPRLARWASERERRSAVVASARAQGRPDVTLSAGPRLIGKGEDVTLVAGFSLPLPLWNRNQGNIAEAEVNLNKSADEQRAAETSAFARLNAVYQVLARAGSQIKTLDQEVLPGARTALDKVLEGYEAGRYNQLDAFEARRTLNEARALKLRVLTDYQKASAELDSLTAAPIGPRTSKTDSSDDRNHDRRSTNK